MSTLDRLKELEAKAMRDKDLLVVDAITEESIQEVFVALPKLLALVEAADDLAFQYEGILEWDKETDNECDDQEKLVEVLEAYRKAKAEL